MSFQPYPPLPTTPPRSMNASMTLSNSDTSAHPNLLQPKPRSSHRDGPWRPSPWRHDKSYNFPALCRKLFCLTLVSFFSWFYVWNIIETSSLDRQPAGYFFRRQHTFLGMPIRALILIVWTVANVLRQFFHKIFLMRRNVTAQEMCDAFVFYPTLFGLFYFFGRHNGVPYVAAFRINDYAWASINIVLFVVGHLFNVASELQRGGFKRYSANRLYTGGWFSYARHINFFGEWIIFVGWSFATGSELVVLIVSVMMFLILVKRMDELECYLRHRYRDSWAHYVKITPSKMIPLVW